jgi:glutathione S-transferase
MKQWISLADGLNRPGLRLVLLRSGMPSPWSEFCRAIFHVKQLEYEQLDGRDPVAGLKLLREVTAQESMPVAFWNDERPRANWLELLHLAERLREEPRLLPDKCDERVRTIGLCAELCSEGGFGWHRRILLIHNLLTNSDFHERERRIGHYLAGKYGYEVSRVDQSRQRCEDIVALFARLQAAQNEPGSYFDGNRLSAIDLAWAAFAALIRPLPQEHCPMSDLWRALYSWEPVNTSAESVTALLQRRDRIYKEHLRLPIVVT